MRAENDTTNEPLAEAGPVRGWHIFRSNYMDMVIVCYIAASLLISWRYATN